MSKHLEKDVNQVRNRILDLGEMVAESIETASAMIQNYDLVLVDQVYEVEHLIDTIEVEIEEDTLLTKVDYVIENMLKNFNVDIENTQKKFFPERGAHSHE